MQLRDVARSGVSRYSALSKNSAIRSEPVARAVSTPRRHLHQLAGATTPFTWTKSTIFLLQIRRHQEDVHRRRQQGRGARPREPSFFFLGNGSSRGYSEHLRKHPEHVDLAG
jgi:hypothetical protein